CVLMPERHDVAVPPEHVGQAAADVREREALVGVGDVLTADRVAAEGECDEVVAELCLEGAACSAPGDDVGGRDRNLRRAVRLEAPACLGEGVCLRALVGGEWTTASQSSAPAPHVDRATGPVGRSSVTVAEVDFPRITAAYRIK